MGIKGKKMVVVNNYRDWDKKLEIILRESERREKQVERERAEILEDLLSKFNCEQDIEYGIKRD